MVEVQYYLQWIPKTIQIKLIHLLGGYTKDEYRIYSSTVHNKTYENGAKYGFEIEDRKQTCDFDKQEELKMNIKYIILNLVKDVIMKVKNMDLS